MISIPIIPIGNKPESSSVYSGIDSLIIYRECMSVTKNKKLGVDKITIAA